MTSKIKWKPVVGYEGIYEISNDGFVRSLERSFGKNSKKQTQINKPTIKTGYFMITLRNNGKSKDYSIHRLVATAFINNPKKLPEVNHKNGCPIDNRVENLEWCNREYNMKHAVDNQLLKGEKSGGVKLTNRDVKAIRSLSNKVTQKDLCEAFEMSTSAISKIIKKKSWTHI